MKKALAAAALFGLFCVPLGVAAEGLQRHFPAAAFLVEKPTALYRAPGAKPLQTQRVGGPPLPLEGGETFDDASGGRYYRLATGEYILARTPAAAGGSEAKGRPVRLPDPDLRARTGAAAVRAWSRADTSGPGQLLAADTPVRPLYALEPPAAPLVRVAYGDGEGWVAYAALTWTDPPSAPERPAAASSRRQAADLLLAEYNRGVERARAYYRETTGTLVEARTLTLVDWEEDGPRLYLGVRDGHLPLQAEELLLSLLRRQLGQGLQVEWP